MSEPKGIYGTEAKRVIELLFPKINMSSLRFKTTRQKIVGSLAQNLDTGESVLIISSALFGEGMSVFHALLAHEGANTLHEDKIPQHLTLAYSGELNRLYDLKLGKDEEMKRQLEIKLKYEVRMGMLISMTWRKLHVDATAIQRMKDCDISDEGYIRFLEINKQMDDERITCPIRREAYSLSHEMRRGHANECISGNPDPEKYSTSFRRFFLEFMESKGIEPLADMASQII